MVHYHRIEDLPGVIPVFPLPGALLFPRWELPLNIFEPRYLNMFDDAMAGDRMIGMVQSLGGPRDRPDLARVGCAGRITRYSETDDGRYLVTLTGICRFEAGDELAVTSPYRQVRPGWAAFSGDLFEPAEEGLPARAELTGALRAYTDALSLQADWSAVGHAPMETLIHALSAGCPFSPAEKQALLEAPDLAERARTLIALMRLAGSGGDPGPVQ